MGPGEYAAAHAKLLDLLGPSPTAVDELIRRCQFSAAAVMSILLDLEIAGRVELLAGNRVALLAEPGQDWSEPDARGPSGG
jgi:DNA processing protein